MARLLTNANSRPPLPFDEAPASAHSAHNLDHCPCCGSTTHGYVFVHNPYAVPQPGLDVHNPFSFTPLDFAHLSSTQPPLTIAQNPNPSVLSICDAATSAFTHGENDAKHEFSSEWVPPVSTEAIRIQPPPPVAHFFRGPNLAGTVNAYSINRFLSPSNALPSSVKYQGDAIDRFFKNSDDEIFVPQAASESFGHSSAPSNFSTTTNDYPLESDMSDEENAGAHLNSAIGFSRVDPVEADAPHSGAEERKKKKKRRRYRKRMVCLDYLQGTCSSKRWQCRFAHPPLDSVSATGGLTGNTSASHDADQETEECLQLVEEPVSPPESPDHAVMSGVCAVWALTGECKFGSECRFLHVSPEINEHGHHTRKRYITRRNAEVRLSSQQMASTQ